MNTTREGTEPAAAAEQTEQTEQTTIGPDTVQPLKAAPCQQLRTMRRAAGLSQERLGRLAGVSHYVIGSMESGSRLVRDRTREKVWQALGRALRVRIGPALGAAQHRGYRSGLADGQKRGECRRVEQRDLDTVKHNEQVADFAAVLVMQAHQARRWYLPWTWGIPSFAERLADEMEDVLRWSGTDATVRSADQSDT